MEKIPECPFCGANENIEQGLVSCSDKECWLYKIQIPINEWQQRPLESALRARVAELEAAVRAFGPRFEDWIKAQNEDVAFSSAMKFGEEWQTLRKLFE